MNPSDFVITGAIGSLVANMVLAKNVSIVEGLAAVRRAVRDQGVARLEDVEAVVLEIDGAFTVIPGPHTRASALDDVPTAGRAAS